MPLYGPNALHCSMYRLDFFGMVMDNLNQNLNVSFCIYYGMPVIALEKVCAQLDGLL